MWILLEYEEKAGCLLTDCGKHASFPFTCKNIKL